jgi:ribonuclease HI
MSKISEEPVHPNQVDKQWKLKSNNFGNDNTATEVNIQNNSSLEAWTDGSRSLKNQEMGCAAILVDPNNTETKIILKEKPSPSTQISSTRPELWAIYKTIQTLKHQETIKIYTDSQGSIDVITSCLKSTPIRELWKKQNNMIIHQIVETIKTNNIKINLIKVKAHANIELNEGADKCAKEACNQIETRIGQHNITSNILFYKSQQQNIFIEEYPAQYLNKKF